MFANKSSALLAVVLGGVFLGAFYQNMSPVEFAALNMPPIDEGARRVQARELLGTYYGGSFAQSFEGQKDMNYLIYRKLESSFSSKWKKWLPQMTEELIRECQKRDMDPVFILAIIQTESQFNVYAKGTSGEIGLMQVLPQTAAWMAKKYHLPWQGPNSLYDPITNIKFGITYFAHLRSQFESRAHHYVPAYNMGPKNLRRIARSIVSMGEDERDLLDGIYGSKVMKNYQMIYQQMVQGNKSLPNQWAQDASQEELVRTR
ncbi:MAG TPA: lytic transglycosylase domain-containing protein [Pseudobdellovibrionaceae bacterium]|jgi:soluble lytic murein transglycosylase